MDAGDVALVVLEAAHHVREAWEALQVLVEEGLLPVDLEPEQAILGAMGATLTAYTQGR